MILLVHLAATWYMTGVIWLVQLVHYPLLGRVGDAFDDCQKLHLARMGWVVAPAMLTEAMTGAMLLWQQPSKQVFWMGGLLLLAIWVSTFLLQVPRHRELERKFDANAHTRLVHTNWIRTVAWTARALLLTIHTSS